MTTNTEIREVISWMETNEELSYSGMNALALLRNILAEREWRDMDSAPTDGTRFLAWGSYVYPGDEFPTVYTDTVAYSGDERYPWRTFDDGNHPSCSFTKWLPLRTPEGGE